MLPFLLAIISGVFIAWVVISFEGRFNFVAITQMILVIILLLLSIGKGAVKKRDK